MRLIELFEGRRAHGLSQGKAARMLGRGGHERAFRRYIDRYHDEGLAGLADKRLAQDSHRRAPVDWVLKKP